MLGGDMKLELHVAALCSRSALYLCACGNRLPERLPPTCAESYRHSLGSVFPSMTCERTFAARFR